MNISKGGIALLIEREDKRNKVYLDSVGIPTVGVGHTGPEVVYGDTWTDDQVEAAFRKDLERFEKAVNEGVKVEIDQYQFDALVSFAFNVGVGAFLHSTLLRKLNEGDTAGAAAQFDVWHIPPEITPRRNGEREQFKGARLEARIP